MRYDITKYKSDWKYANFSKPEDFHYVQVQLNYAMNIHEGPECFFFRQYDELNVEISSIFILLICKTTSSIMTELGD